MCVGILPACVIIYHMCTYGGQGTASDPLELKLQMVLRYQVGAGNQPWIICRVASTLPQ